MNVSTQGLTLDLSPHTTANAEGWAKLNVAVEVPGFTGQTIAWMQVADLRRFCDELEEMDRNLGRPTKARLCSAEPDLDLQLEMNRSGQIEGSFYLESQRPNGVPTCLSCGFELDQTFVTRLKKQAEQLVAQLAETKTF